jgi:plasmid stabilization system protein ParE
MEEYRVEILPRAQQDMREIVDAMNSLSPKSASRHYDHLVESIRGLSEAPTPYPLVSEPRLKLRGYRKLTVANYIVFFVIDGQVARIRRILFWRRKYSDIL